MERDEIPPAKVIGGVDLIGGDDRTANDDRHDGFRLGAFRRRGVDFGNDRRFEAFPERNLDDAPPGNAFAEGFGHEIREPFGIE